MSAQKYTKPIVYTNNLPIFFVILRAITPKINHILLQFVLNPSNRFNRPQACFILVKGLKSKVEGFLMLFLEMLEVFAAVPLATPAEAVADEETVAKVALVDFVGEGLGAVAVGSTRCGLYEAGAVAAVDVIGVVEGIDVHS